MAIHLLILGWGKEEGLMLKHDRIPCRTVTNSHSSTERVKVAGKFLSLSGNKHWVRGVTYGTFAPNADGSQYYNRKFVERDFAHIASSGLNTIRTYTVPPRWLLDAAYKHGLRVMVGLAWEQHITFLDGRKQTRSIENSIRDGVRACAEHPAVLCYAIGNEIPAPLVRWYRAHRIEAWLENLFQIAREQDPQGLFTYVNYPSTEYIELPSADLVCFNVYLETKDRLSAYIARLQNIAGNRPLMLAEIGLDSLRNGIHTQAKVLDWQIRTAFEHGCAGAFVFAWTDEWHRGGYDIQDWDFGLTDRKRQPKPALAAVRRAFGDVPLKKEESWPRISVVVCTHNGSRIIRDCCEGLTKLDYPDFEVIVVDDGSTDRTAEIVKEYPEFRLIETENRGLSSARNTGLAAATGEIVAYTDDDAYPDQDWLKFIANTLLNSDHAGAGGPNIPPDDGLIAECVANAPGGPIHVLLSDQVAEHIPGCNMAFWKDKLEAIGGFDVRYRAAGDDVDVCWRLQQRGWTLGFNAAAMVWHRRRNSVRAYWRQQKGYGKAEALLEEKWPEKYNGPGHLTWAGRIYNNAKNSGDPDRRIFHGVWGSAPFQSVYEVADGFLTSLPLMPEWFLIIGFLTTLSALGLFWKPLRYSAIFAVSAAATSLIRAWHCAGKTAISKTGKSDRLKRRGLTTCLHLIQPIARLAGRLRSGLTPWRRNGEGPFRFPRSCHAWIWSEQWRSLTAWLEFLESEIRATGATVVRGGEFDHWDLEVRDGTFASLRIRATLEEHGGGRQLVRFHSLPRVSPVPMGLGLLCTALSAAAAIDQAAAVTVILSVPAAWLFLRIVSDSGIAAGIVDSAIAGVKNMTSLAARTQERSSFAVAPAAGKGRPRESEDSARATEQVDA
jgi:GT2 family glycosyltransferase